LAFAPSRDALELARFDVARCPGASGRFDAASVLDEYLLGQPVRLAHEFFVVSLAHLSNLFELWIGEGSARLAERRERVLRLTGGHDVANEPEEVAFSRGIGEVSGNPHCLPQDLLRDAGLRANLPLIVLEHSLVLAHLWNGARAQVAIARVLRLLFVIFQVLEERTVLHDGVVDLALQEIDASVHEHLRVEA
jgi:hypothetical protein